MFILAILAIILIVGLVPILVHENVLHNIATKFSLTEKSNLDKIYRELKRNEWYIKSLSSENKFTLTNCDCVCQFTKPMKISYDIVSSNNLGNSYREYNNITTLNVFALNGDIECSMSDGLNTYKVLIMEDIHQMEISMSSEK